MSFASFSRQRQARAVREALEGLVGNAPVKLVTHGFNSTYRVSLASGDVAVRLNINSRRTPAMVRGEIAMIQRALAAGVRVPEPVPLFGGQPMTTTRIEGIEHDVPVVAYRWIPGRAPSEACHPATMERLGALLAQIQRATEGWQLPEGAERPVYREVLDGLPWRLSGSAAAEVRERADVVLARLGQPQLVHFDLHLGNVKQHEGQLTAYDFDDSVWGHPAVDVAQSLFYFRWGKDIEKPEAAFWRGMGTTPEALGVDRTTVELLVAARAVLLANDVVGAVTQELQAMAPRYVEVTEMRLKHFLETGTYDPRVARMKS